MPDPLKVWNANPTGRAAAEYVLHGLAVCPISAGGKGPRTKGWNERCNAITDVRMASNLRDGVGLLHAYSGTMALDVDNGSEAIAWLQARGVDLRRLLRATDAVAVRSGRPGKAKLLYRLPPNLPTLETVKISGPSGMVWSRPSRWCNFGCGRGPSSGGFGGDV